MTSDAFLRNRDNFCYRHPDRQSFVLCQRCGRTVCPECQTQAAVGVICPECMKEQRAAQTPVQRKAERRWATRSVTAVDTRPLATYVIIAATVLAYIVTFIPGFGDQVGQALAFNATYVVFPHLTGVFEPWRILTVALTHGSFWHLGLNMLALWMIGRSLEPLLGRGRFIALYLLSAAGGSVGVALLAPSQWVVGASGAIFGLFGALIVIGRHIGANIAGIAIILAINLAIGFIPGMGVSWQAHVGGLVVGLIVGFVYVRTRSPRQRTAQIGLLVAIGVGLVALLIIPAFVYA
ncbi:rhomboid family intramembrane serine protease [Microbacterium aoyamense]|uniref:Rhomboid family intramembrane serine protease n=1 Tax=Microbacterium aoyamense TaxID=344166 RepID=A0ABP5AXL1_9MICO|nr:rhomboid family intramembrane serine protease [Microbacterium aoyamense]